MVEPAQKKQHFYPLSQYMVENKNQTIFPVPLHGRKRTKKQSISPLLYPL